MPKVTKTPSSGGGPVKATPIKVPSNDVSKRQGRYSGPERVVRYAIKAAASLALVLGGIAGALVAAGAMDAAQTVASSIMAVVLGAFLVAGIYIWRHR